MINLKEIKNNKFIKVILKPFIYINFKYTNLNKSLEKFEFDIVLDNYLETIGKGIQWCIFPAMIWSIYYTYIHFSKFMFALHCVMIYYLIITRPEMIFPTYQCNHRRRRF